MRRPALQDFWVGPVARFVIQRAYALRGDAGIDLLRYHCGAVSYNNQLRGIALADDPLICGCISSSGKDNATLAGNCYAGSACIDEKGITFNSMPESTICHVLNSFEPGMGVERLVELPGFPPLKISRISPLQTLSDRRMLRCVFAKDCLAPTPLIQTLAELDEVPITATAA